MLDGLNNNVINYFRAVLADITYSARTAISSSLYGVPLATIAFMSVAAGTSLALLVSGPEDISYPNETRNMVGGTIDDKVEPISNNQPNDENQTQEQAKPQEQAQAQAQAQEQAQAQVQAQTQAQEQVIDNNEDNITGGQLKELEQLAYEGKQANRAAARAMRRTARLAAKFPQ